MGKITIEGEIKRGMISIGRVDLKAQGISKIINSGEIIFKGPVILGGATILENSGKIIFEGQTRVGEGVTFLIRSQLTIGKYTSVGFHSFFMDSDDHYMINVQTGEVKENKKEIIIGKYNWIANGTMVKKGTRTPDYTIVASRSLLSKDYTNILSLYSIIGGMPAKSISSGYRRIYNRKEEALLRKFFTENDMPSIIIDLENINIDEYCTKNPLPN
jgi:acetyltransferase-like isoleucine patch superfamily enzyme